MTSHRVAVVVVSGVVLAGLAPVGGRADRGEQAPSSPAAGVDPALLQGLRYRMIGPHRGGRVTAVSGVKAERGTFYMGSSGGGVWKSVDAGEVWENVSDKYFASASIGAIGVSDSNSRVVYVGTGSACLRNNIQPGLGVYKSTDAGATWQTIGLEDGGQVARIQIDPRDPDRVFIAVQGHAFGPNVTRGVFRSRDGGKHWENVLFINERTGASDLAMDAKDSRVLYATVWSGELKPWGLPSVSPDGGVYKTVDGGDHWTKLAGGLPQGPVGRIGIAVSASNPNRVWALVGDVPDGGVFRSDNAGATFTRVNTDRNLTGRSSYYAHIFSDPKDENVVYAANRDFYKSTDAGVTFTPMPMPHGDDHALWIDPGDTRIMIAGNDGGATVSVTGGTSWSSQLNQPTGEMYRVVVDQQVPYRVYGSQQDQYDALSLPSRSASFGERLQLQHWTAVGGYEGAAVTVDPRDPNVVFASGPGGRLTRYDGSVPRIRLLNITAGGRGAYRFAGTPPIVISPLDPDNVYNASNVVHRSSDGGQTFAVISPDLTGGARSRAAVGGAGAAQDEGGGAWPTITAFDESRKERGVLWAGTDDGLVQLTRDNGATWKNVTPPDMPRFGLVNTIEPSPHDPGRAFLAVTAYRTDDYKPFVYRTDNYGQSWTLLTRDNGIPSNHFIRVVREDPVRKGLLYAGGEFGMYVSFDDGRRWQSLQLNLPVTPVTDLAVSQGDLAISTNGRSFWILDDITPLRELASPRPSGSHLFAPRDAYRIQTAAEENDDAYVFGACCVSNARDLYSGARIERHQLGEEPPDGAIVYASFDRVPAEAVALSILNGNAVVRTVFDTSRRDDRAPAIAAGLNRFNWDLRADPLNVGRPGAVLGRKVVPGRYTVRLTVGAKSQSAPLNILMDPRLARAHVTAADLQNQSDLLDRLREAVGQIQRASSTINDRLGRGGQADGGRSGGPSDSAALTALQRELVGAAGEGRGGGGGRGGAPSLLSELISLYQFVGASEDKPSAGAAARWTELKQSLDEKIARAHALGAR